MWIIIGIVIVLVALGFSRTLFRTRKLASYRKHKQDAPAAKVQTEPKLPELPDSPEISDEELKNKLDSLKKWIRIRRLAKIAGVLGTVAIFGMAGFHGSMPLTEFALKFLAPAVVNFAIMCMIWTKASSHTEELESVMGNAITLPVLREIFDVKGYQAHGHIDRETVASAGLIGGWEDIGGSDFFTGSYRGINIMYSDVKLSHEETRTNDGKETKVTVTDFEGQWLVCDFGKELSASVRLIERKGDSGGAYVIDMIKSDIETENIEFNKKYRIMTEDGHAAFYLLTPHFMERLMAADELAKATTRFYFGDGKAHIALGSGYDFFELGNAKLKNIDSVRQKFRREIKRLTDIVDELLLNEKLFKEV